MYSIFIQKGYGGLEYKMNKIREIMYKYEIDKGTIIKVLLIMTVLIASLVIKSSARPNKHIENNVSKSKPVKEQNIEENVVIDISGEVRNPGIYKMKGKVRLYEVIEKAGGIKDEANIDSINQARFVTDGEKIIIPSSKDKDAGEGTSISSEKDDLVNINFASKEELMKLPGVGEVTADRIIEYRKKSSYSKKEDLKNVNGIGEATYKKLENMISI